MIDREESIVKGFFVNRYFQPRFYGTKLIFVELTRSSSLNLSSLFLSAFPRVSSGSAAITCVPICILIAAVATLLLGPSS